MEGNTYNIDAQHTVDLWSSNKLTYGLNYRHNTYLNNRFFPGPALEERLGLYIQDEWHITPTLTAVGGVRFDMDTFISPTYSPRGALIYSPIEDHTFRASASVGYRPPTITETHDHSAALFNIPPFPPFVSFLQGNNGLVPEQIISYELEYQGWYLKHRLRVRGAVFFNHISELIGTRLQGAGSIYNNGGNTFSGTGEADIRGGEAGFEYLATTWLSTFANFSYVDIGQTYRGGISRGAPRWKSNAGIRTEFQNGLSGEMLVHYVGSANYNLNGAFFSPLFLAGNPAPSTTVSSYTLLNLRGAYRFWQEKTAGREAEFAVSAFNALNDKHKEHPLGETIGSLVMGWLTVKY
jgi:iron complex outermembrane receptor protein